jgi:lipopolysaccharide/colanic/teichoic acid biosynthesis glycosyltransferase
VLKRGFDILVSATALVLLSPVILATAVAVRIALGSPVLFRQVRPGLGGRPFELVKFRTMRHDPAGGADVSKDAQRLTRFGSALRATSLDELPQLWNVLRGDMSLVGPRPLLMQYLERYTPRQARRHEVRPGITGWAQVNGRNALSWEAKFELDVWYVENRSFLLDLRIILLTLLKVVRPAGVSGGGAATMTEYMGPAPAKVERGADPE